MLSVHCLQLCCRLSINVLAADERELMAETIPGAHCGAFVTPVIPNCGLSELAYINVQKHTSDKTIEEREYFFL